jgi:hypothetical protein
MTETPKRLTVPSELVAALQEIAPPGITWQAVAEAFVRGRVAEFWDNARQGSGLTLERYRERTRAFLREGDSLTEACRKARTE